MLLDRKDDGTETASFEFGFTLDRKAVVDEGDDGCLYIEGLASDFDVDRQEEAFEPGAFEEGLKSYMETNPILLYHHKPDTALGQVVQANITPQGLHVKARIDKPEPGTIVADYVNKIKSGTLRAFSVGGKWYRRLTESGPRIYKADLGEISVTPYPINSRSLFAVATKSFGTGLEQPEDVVIEVPEELAESVRELSVTLDKLEGKATGSDGSTPQAAKPLHPDRHQVALLLMHQQKVHTLATDISQNAADPEVQQVAAKAAASAKKHSAALHHIAARIGPLPDYYGPLA